MPEEEITPPDMGQEEGGQEEPQEGEPPAIDDSTIGAAESQQQTVPDFDWSQYKNAERFSGRGVQDVVDYINQRECQYGQQGNEMGRLRSIEQEFNKLKTQISGKPQTEKKAEFSDVETAMFVDEFNKNPANAITKFLLPRLTDSLQKQVLEKATQQLNPILEERVNDVASQQEFNSFVKSHSDYAEHKPMMHRLMAADYLGDQVPYEEVYNLAVMAKKEASLFGTTCAFMQRGIPFDTAKKYAAYERDAAANAKKQKEQIKQEVDDVSAGLKRDGTKQKTSESEVVTMDDAFAA